MFGNGRTADIKIVRHPVQGQRIFREQADDLSSCGVGDGLEYVPSHRKAFM
jgi:hypothetical protein